MLNDDDPSVVSELQRRIQVRAKADAKLGVGDENQERMVRDRVGKVKKDDTKAKGSKEKDKEKDDTGKWQLTHQQLAESRALAQPTISGKKGNSIGIDISSV